MIEECNTEVRSFTLSRTFRETCLENPPIEGFGSIT